MASLARRDLKKLCNPLFARALFPNPVAKVHESQERIDSTNALARGEQWDRTERRGVHSRSVPYPSWLSFDGKVALVRESLEESSEPSIASTSQVDPSFRVCLPWGGTVDGIPEQFRWRSISLDPWRRAFSTGSNARVSQEDVRVAEDKKGADGSVDGIREQFRSRPVGLDPWRRSFSTGSNARVAEEDVRVAEDKKGADGSVDGIREQFRSRCIGLDPWRRSFSTGSNARVSEEDVRVSEGKRGTDGTAASVGSVGWVERVVPKQLRPYVYLARLDKPIGTWLLAWPCFWSIAIAAEDGGYPDLKLLTLFGVGAVLLRGAGCTVNDLLDRDIDGKVERTKLRPIVSGALTPFQGVTFLGCQLLLGLGILLQLNTFSQVLGASSLLLVGTYPLMKRWTFWPQAYLGLTFNWGALLGWAAVRGGLDPSVVLPLYLSGVCWTLVYDTIYAHQDKEDDTKVGVKSTALRFGNDTRVWLTGFSTASVIGMTLAGFNAGLGWPFYLGVGATAGHLAWQVSTVDTHNRADCNDKFVSNKWLGALLFSGICLGKIAV